MKDKHDYNDNSIANYISYSVAESRVHKEPQGFWSVEDMTCGVILGVIYSRPRGYEWHSDASSGMAATLEDSRYAIVASGFIFGTPAIA